MDTMPYAQRRRAELLSELQKSQSNGIEPLG
jgi:hypothetical protein